MRFMVMIKANKQSEAGIMPSVELVTAMGKFNDEMMKAGVLLAADGLQPSSKGARIKFSGGKHTVIDGPFAEAKELIAGFWMIQVKSKADAIAWASRCPGGKGEVDHFGGEFEIEIRQVFDMEDFPADVRAAVCNEETMRANLEQRRNA